MKSYLSFILLFSISLVGFAQSYQYEYDALGRVIKITYPSGLYVKYMYDKVGNRINKLENTLPITLLNLSGKEANNEVSLQWTTIQETNSSHFEVEHSTTENGIFQSFTQVKAAGYSHELKNYTTLHHQPNIGNNYYRLKMIDIDGSFQYSNIVNIVFSGVNNLLTIYPNPANTQITTQFSLPTFVYEIKIYNNIGEIVSKYELNNTIRTYTIPTSNLSTGTYIIQVIAEGNSFIQKVFIEK